MLKMDQSELDELLSVYGTRKALWHIADNNTWAASSTTASDCYSQPNGVRVHLMYEDGVLVYAERGTDASSIHAEISHPASEPELVKVAAMFLEDVE